MWVYQSGDIICIVSGKKSSDLWNQSASLITSSSYTSSTFDFAFIHVILMLEFSEAVF